MKKKRQRSRISIIEELEPRRLLSAAVQLTTAADSTSSQVQPVLEYHPTYHILSTGLTPFQTSGPTGFTPDQIRAAYGLNQVSFGAVSGDGTGQTIAIIDAYNDPTIQADLVGFDNAFGLPSTSLRVVSQTGTTKLPRVDPAGAGNDNWEGEEALDVEWAHAMAPGASIILVEATDSSPSNLFAAVNWARQQAGVSVVSMSFGGNETSSETQYDPDFTTPSGHTGVTFVASTGDSGAPAGFPALSPNVVAAGGTSLAIDSLGNYQSETGWSGSGGGISSVEAQPAYQKGIVTQSTTFRTNPDIAFDADPSTGVSIYDSYNNGAATPWEVIGGTSVAAPAWAGIFAVADQGRVIAGEGTLDSATGALPLLYSAPAADFHDITSGNNGFSAKSGYDLVTGRGSPKLNLLIPFLVTGIVTPPPPPPQGPTIDSLTANSLTITEGSSLTLTAQNPSDPGGAGLTLTFYEETNNVPGLQTDPSTGDFSFTPITDGTNSISLDTSNALGTFTFYAQLTDSSGGASLAGTSAPSVTVTIVAPSDAGPTIANITADPNPIISGDPLVLTANGLTDPQTSVRRVYFYEETNGVPGLQTGVDGDFSFRPVNAFNGYSIQLDTTGVTGPVTFYGLAVDNNGNVSATGADAPSVSVDIMSDSVPDAPTDLTATAASSSEIDLSFSEVDSGQTGFTIERALNPAFTNFTRLFTINRANVLAYSDTGLNPNTHYYYRVEAFDAAGDSDFSNPASAATLVPSTRLHITKEPASVAAGHVLAPVIVQIRNAMGQVDTTNTSDVTLAIRRGPGGGELAGTLTVPAVAGVATFSDLSITKAGLYVLTATDAALTAAISVPFTVKPDPNGAHLAIIQDPTGAVVGKKITPTLRVEIDDQFDNVITNNLSKIGVSIVNGPIGGTLTGVTSMSALQGIANFANLLLSKPGNYTLQVSDSTLADNTPATFPVTITPGLTAVAAPLVAPAYTFGRDISLAAMFQSNAPLTIPFSGAATINDQMGAPLGSANLLSTGSAKFILSGVPAGTYTCTVNYPGDANHAAATSSTFILQINLAG